MKKYVYLLFLTPRNYMFQNNLFNRVYLDSVIHSSRNSNGELTCTK